MANTAQNKDRAAVQNGLNDLLGNVIQNDRQRSGRGRPPAPENSPSAEPDLSAESNPLQVVTGPPSSAPHTTSSEPELMSSKAQPPDNTNPGNEDSCGGTSDIMTDTHSDIMTNGQVDEDQNLRTDQTSRNNALSGTAPPSRTDFPSRTESARAGTAPQALAAPSRRKSRPASTTPLAAHSDPLLVRVEERVEGTVERRVGEAEALSETPTMTVTLRIPQGFNEWLDGYVHGSWPQRIRKQELVVEALRLIYARRGKAGEEIIATPLLGEDEEA